MVASINPDAAGIGAPVVDLDGRVIGIVHKVEQDPEHRIEPGGATAIPGAQLRAVFEHIRAGGAVKRAWFGMGLQSIAPEILADLGAPEGGIYVSAVKSGGPADAAGMKVGDIMVSLTVLGGKQEKPITLRRHVDLTAATEWAEPGTRVRVDIVRDGRPAQLVSEVDPSGLGHLLGIREGDLIVRVSRKACRSAADFEEAIAALRGKPRVTIELRRAEPDVVASYVVSGSL
jgi:S1-C subfamily serine protease